MTSHPPASETRPAHTTKRWRLALLLLAVALLAAGGGTAAVWWSRRPLPAVAPMPGEIQDPQVRLAVEHARQKVLEKPNDAAAWGLLGMTLEAHLYEAEADQCFAEAARLDPADAEWPYFRGLYALKYDPDNALAYFRQAAARRSLPEDEPAIRLRLAEALLEYGNQAEAEGLFRDEWRRAPGNPRAAYGLGLIALARGEAKDAVYYLGVARGSPTARRPATAHLAALARTAGDDEAAARYDRDVGPRPGDVLAWPDPLVEQILRFKVGADTLAQEVAELEREYRFAELAQLYLKQIETQPTVAAYVGAGVNLGRLGDYERGLPLLREAVRLEPDSVEAHYTLALTQFARAEKAVQQSPSYPQVKEWLQEVVEHARRAAELKPDHARAYLVWGLALKYLGDPAGAVAPLKKGVTCRPGDIDLQFALGQVLAETGRNREAVTHLENAHKLDPKNEQVTTALERLRKKDG
jgi:tetratricopeptide (TPR) repeat protein